MNHAFRQLLKNPGFTVIAFLTLAVGIGATTAIFSIAYSVVLQPLPFGEPERLVALWSLAPKLGNPHGFVSAADHRDWREQNHVFEDVALVRHIANFNLTGEGEPERLQGARIAANLFPVLKVQPALGRGFNEEEDEIGHDQVALLSYRLWQRRFGGDRSVVGKTIRLNGIPHTIVGVMGKDFNYPSRDFDLWTPLVINPEDFKTRLGFNFLSIARLKTGVSLQQAQVDMDTIAARLEIQYPATNEGIGVLVAPLLDDTVVSVRTALYVLLGAVGCVLLIGCVNLANLLLVQASGRNREWAIRLSLGASRRRLVQQALVEITPVVVLGGGLGILLATWSLELFLPWMPASMPRVEEIHISPPVLAFSVGLMVLSGLLAGIWPAFQVTGTALAGSLKEGSLTTSDSPHRRRLRDALVVVEIAVAVVLLTGAGLLIRSFMQVKGVHPGFRTDRVLSMHLAISRSKYGTDRAVARFCQQVLERVQALPGVVSAGMVNRLPLGGGIQTGAIQFEGSDLPVSRIENIDWRTVTPGYFQTLGIPLLRGRTFSESDIEDSKLVGIIDDRIASRVWPNQNPVGKRFRIPYLDLPWVAIVGVVGHIRHDSLETDTRLQIYWNYHQRAQDRMALAVRTHEDPNRMIASIVSEIRVLDLEQPVYDVRSMEDVVKRSLAPRWLNMVLLTAFASASLLMACIGLYGVIAYSVSQRTREFGIYMALGAQAGDVLRLVLRKGMMLAFGGAVAGLAVAAAVTRVLSSLLYGVQATDALSFAASSLLLVVVALVACYVPARRATKVDPIVALRYE
jgi:putative ABC transport system permease protein